MVKKPIPQLYVVFDTNVLYTKLASELLNQEAKVIISEHSHHADLEITWYLPDVVVGERRYQMMRFALDLLPSLEKMERLLKHSFGIGKENLNLHVNDAIASSVKSLGLNIATLDESKVDWTNIISRSVERLPPFEDNDKEKGFRDAVIGMTFVQLHANAPTNPSVCKVAMVTSDNRLIEFVEECTRPAKNVRVLKSLDELANLINTLVSEISEELVAQLSEKATKLFFEQDNDKSLYHKANIRQQLLDKYAATVFNKREPGKIRRVLNWRIEPPVFRKKEHQRIHWTSTIEIDFEIHHLELTYSADDPSLSSSAEPQSFIPNLPGTWVPSNLLASASRRSQPPSSVWSSRAPFANKHLEKVVDALGWDKFEIYWSANLNQAQNLTHPKVHDIKYLGSDLL